MTPRDKRALVWGGIAVAVAIVALRAVPWTAGTLSRLRATATEQQVLLARSRAVLEGRRSVEDSLHQTLRSIVALAPRLVEGRSAAESQASLASWVSHEAGRNAVKVLRLDALPDSSIGVFSRVALRAELEGDIAGVIRLLRSLETSDPALSATSLRITAPDPSASERVAEMLRVEMDVAGYYLPRAQ